MKMLSKGSSLIEFVIYFLLCMFAVMLFTLWIARTGTVVVQHQRTMLQQITVQNAHDVLCRDIQNMSYQRSWKKNRPSCYIWTTLHADVGWEIVHNNLIRSEGFFNEGRWIQRKKMCCAQGITGIDITMNRVSEGVCHAIISLKMSKRRYTRSVFINGSVYA